MRRRLLLHLLFAGILAGCASAVSTTSQVADVVPLRAGVAPNYEPVIFKQGGEISGIEADLAGLMAESLGRPVELVEMSWFELIPALEESRIDIIMSGMSVTPARREQVLFTDPYMQVGQMALIRTADLGRISDSLSLYRTREKIGFEHGTTDAPHAGPANGFQFAGYRRRGVTRRSHHRVHPRCPDCLASCGKPSGT
jgi:polar amino acid transport system substrate-binding protein